MDKFNNLYIADNINHRILKYSSGAKKVNVVAGGNGRGFQLNQLNGPVGVWVDEYHNLFVADTLNHRVLKFVNGSDYGIIIAGLDELGHGYDQLSYPSAVTVDHFGNVYIADTGNHRIIIKYKFIQEYSYIIDGNNLNLDGQKLIISYPDDVKVDILNRIYISDTNNNRIIMYDPHKLKAFILIDKGLDHPSGIFIDNQFNLYIADTFNYRILKLIQGHKSPIQIAGGLGRGSRVDQFIYPRALCLDDGGNLYISDPGNQRIMVYYWFKDSNSYKHSKNKIENIE